MDEEPKSGLMVSLILMNLTAVALFFFAATSPKKQADIVIPQPPLPTPVEMVEMVMAGDTEKNVFDHNALPLVTHAELGAASVQLKMADIDTLSPQPRPPETINGSAETEVFRQSVDTSNRFPASVADAEPPFATALKRFVVNSKVGVTRIFQGLKNGYMEKRASTLTPPKQPTPTQESRESIDNLILGPRDEVSDVNQENFISTEMIMDILSNTQRRTDQLIEIFSKKVVPAIERMNGRVAEAIRLEKNLDEYTSTLIKAIDSVVCPPVEVKPEVKAPLSGTETARKSRKGKRSELSLTQPTSQNYGSIGGFSIGERSEGPVKRPVFKTLIARCLHYRQARRSCKKCARNRDQLDAFDPTSLVERVPLGAQDEPTRLYEPTGVIEDNQSYNIAPFKGNVQREGTCAEKQGRTIGIEDVLALTSSLEQSYDQDIRVRSGMGFTFDRFSDFSMSSGMAQCVIDRHEHDSAPSQEHSTLNLIPNHSPESDVPQQVRSLTDCTVVCDSRIQGYDSYLGGRENSIVQCPGPEHRTDLHSSLQDTEHPSSNTNDLVKVFKRLDLQGKEIAMEKVCLLVLRIFEAWSESLPSVSSLGVSRMSLSSWSSKDETGQNRPRTAIFKSAIMDPVPEQQCANSNQADSLPVELDAIPQNMSEHDLTEISRSLVQCVVEAAEVQIVEQSLKDLKANTHRTTPTKCDKVFPGSLDAPSPTGFGDMKDAIAPIENDVPLASKSQDSITEASKDSSCATFYTGQPESSEDAFYECISTVSAATYGSLELEDSSKLFLEGIQEEEPKCIVDPKIVVRPKTTHSSFSVDSWLNESGEDLLMTKDEITSLEFSDNSSVDVGCGTDDECPSNSLDDFGADSTQKEKRKKKKWGVQLLKKFLKKKSKPAQILVMRTASTDPAVLKLSDSDLAKSVDEHGQ